MLILAISVASKTHKSIILEARSSSAAPVTGARLSMQMRAHARALPRTNPRDGGMRLDQGVPSCRVVRRGGEGESGSDIERGEGREKRMQRILRIRDCLFATRSNRRWLGGVRVGCRESHPMSRKGADIGLGQFQAASAKQDFSPRPRSRKRTYTSCLFGSMPRVP